MEQTNDLFWHYECGNTQGLHLNKQIEKPHNSVYCRPIQVWKVKYNIKHINLP